jgi:hypothetical protein
LSEKQVTEIEVLVGRLEALINELDRVEEKKPPNKAYPPASEEDIVAAEKRLNFRFPSSYRAFLKIHNGWRGMWVWSIFGVSGPGYTEAQKEYEKDLKIFEKVFKRQGPKHAERLKNAESDDPEIIYLPNHPPFGLDYDQNYLVFDRNRPKRGGEFDIAMVSRGESVDLRFPEFVRFLESATRDVRGELRDNGINPDDVDPAPPNKKASSASKKGKATKASSKKKARR